MPKFHIGTSGWHYKHWIGPFYPRGTRAFDMLAFYARHFDIVELNNTFYKLPDKNALQIWRDSTPARFRFTAKGSRFLTHMKKLTDTTRGIDRFFDCADELGNKLGPVVFQLPPRWSVNVERLQAFLEALPRGHRYAFEFRDPSWNEKPVLDVLKKFRAAYCIYELSGYQSPLEITADFTYIRLHGPGGPYQGSYSDAVLRNWANRLKDWNLRAAYILFDNDQAGFAPLNALKLRELTA